MDGKKYFSVQKNHIYYIYIYKQLKVNKATFKFECVYIYIYQSKFNCQS